MPDFGAPVAAGIQNDPSKGLRTLSDLMGLQQQKQGLQLQSTELQRAQGTLQPAIATATAQAQSAQAQAQAGQQAMAERQLLQSSMKKGTDPDGNPLIGPDGETDPVAMTRFATKHLPLTGQDVVQHIVKTQDDRLRLADSTRTLGQNYRDDMAGLLRSSIGDANTPATPAPDIAAKIDAYVQQQGPQAPTELTRAATYAKSLLGNLSANVPQPHQKLALLHLAQQFEPTGAVAAAQSPSVSTVTGAGGGLQPVQLNPLSPVPMGAVGGETRLGVAPQITMNPATGQPAIIGGGRGAPNPGEAGAAPSGYPGLARGSKDARIQPMPTFPTPQEVAQANAANEKWTQVRQADSSPSSGYMPTKQVYANLLNIVKDNPSIGPGSPGLNRMLTFLTPFGLSPNASYQEVAGYLDRLAAQNAAQGGVTTNFAREQAANSTGTAEFNPKALTEKLRFGAAVNEASHAYRTAADAFVGNYGRAAPYNQAKFDSAWSANADPVAFRLLSSHQLGDKKDDIDQKVTPATLKHYRNLRDYLLKGQLPPDEK